GLAGEGDKQKVDIACQCFSADGKRLATVSGQGVLRIWDMVTGAECWQVSSNPGAFVAFIPGSQDLLEIRRAWPEKEWRIDFLGSMTGKEKSAAARTLRNSPDDYFTPGNLCLSADDKLLAETCGRVVRVWEVATGREVGPAECLHGKVRELAFAPNGKKL